MGISNWSGAGIFGANSNDNADGGPLFSTIGFALGDTRPPYAYGNGGNSPITGFAIGTGITAIDAVPAALSATNIALTQVPVVNTPLVLTAGAGTTAVPAGTLPNPATGLFYPSLALVLDGAPAAINTNASGSVRVWNPATLLARNVRITSAGNDSVGSFLVQGADIYGNPMAETIAGANAGVASGRKAFKFILSVTPQVAVSGSNVSVGTGDVYGFPILDLSFFYATIYWNGTQAASPTGFLGADQTTPATRLTGDVRGTYAVPSASDGTKRLTVIIDIAPANISSTAGVFGAPQAA